MSREKNSLNEGYQKQIKACTCLYCGTINNVGFALPMAQDMDAWDNTVMFLDSEDWLGYITGEGYFTYGPCYIVDCDLGEKLGIRAMSN